MSGHKKRISASAIKSLKACPVRYRNSYVYGIRREEDTDIQRIGTNWHECLEVLALKGKDAVVELLNERYAVCPPNKDKVSWERERTILLYSAYAYEWHYDTDENYEVLATEVEFELPLIDPRDGRPVKQEDVALVGKIDKLVRNYNGIPMVQEHKSTSSDVSSGSDYWKGLNLDTQSMLYIYAGRRLQLAGELKKYGLSPDDPLISGCLYDAWHKPQIKPKNLSQADSKKLVETGMYCDVAFDILDEGFEACADAALYIDDVHATVTFGKPNKKRTPYAIMETADMFGTRLLGDIYANPYKYFGRREIPHTTNQIIAFETELFNLFRTMHMNRTYDIWWKNEQQCEDTFKCDYRESCYNGWDILEHIPAGFKGPYPEYIK